MGLLANPWVLLAIVAALVASHGTVAYKAYHAGQDNIVAETSKIVDSEVRTRDAALAVVSEAIGNMKVRNVTIRQKTETLTRELPVYRECNHDADGLRTINEALTGTEQQQPAATGNGVVPNPGAAD